MTRLKLAAHTDDVLRRYRDGESAASIARNFETTTTTVTSFLKKFNAMPSLPRGVADVDMIKDRLKVVSLYEKGYAFHEIIPKLIRDRSRFFLYNAIKAAGLEFRGFTHWSPSEEQKENMFYAVEKAAKMTESEKCFFNLCEARKVECVPQKAFTLGNMDFFLPFHNVCVEVYCRGTFRNALTSGQIEKRLKEFFKLGHHAYFVVADNTADIMFNGIDDMFLWIDFVHRQKTMSRQYRMVRSPGQLLACGCDQSDHFPFITPPE